MLQYIMSFTYYYGTSERETSYVECLGSTSTYTYAHIYYKYKSSINIKQYPKSNKYFYIPRIQYTYTIYSC